MSVEIRMVCERPDDCTLGQVHPIGFRDHCTHRFECDWGVLGNAEADISRGLQHLMLITGDCLKILLEGGPQPAIRGCGTCSASASDDRIFVHLDHDAGRTTWELFDAHFWDGGGPSDLYIGRWPD